MRARGWFVLGIVLVAGPACGQQAEGKPERVDAKMSFQAASVRLSEPWSLHYPPSLSLGADDLFRDPGGSFYAEFPVETYVEFAYKIWPVGPDGRAFLDSLPGWAKTDRYAIRARAPLGATKDQYRQMVQELLAERFGLRVHTEQREEPVLLMTLASPGQPGPKLIPHDKGVPCDAPLPDRFPGPCHAMGVRLTDGIAEVRARATSIELFGKFLVGFGQATGSEIAGTPVDDTGLRGEWDVSMAVTLPSSAGGKPGDATVAWPALLEAMREQLGLILRPGRRTLPVLIVDHIERPRED